MTIIIENFTKTIHGSTVLKDISLELESGKIYGLQGKNGSGKTMLLRALCGFIRPTTGRIIIDGETLHKEISFPRSVGALIENPGFLSNYTGLKNLQLLADIRRTITEEQIIGALKDIGLNPYDKRKYRKYSLGMKQRLGIAAALMEHPAVILLDEPINALDESGAELVGKLLFHARDRGALIIVACHDKEELFYLSDEVFQMENGLITSHIAVKERDENREAVSSV